MEVSKLKKGLLVAVCICKFCSGCSRKRVIPTIFGQNERVRLSMFACEPACSIAVQLSISNQHVRLSILNQCILLLIDTFLKTSDQRIEQITITQLLIAQKIVLERQRCVIKTTDNSQLG